MFFSWSCFPYNCKKLNLLMPKTNSEEICIMYLCVPWGFLLTKYRFLFFFPLEGTLTLSWTRYEPPASDTPLPPGKGYYYPGYDPRWVVCTQSSVAIFNLLRGCYGGQFWFVKALIHSIVDRKLLDMPFPSLGRSTPPET